MSAGVQGVEVHQTRRRYRGFIADTARWDDFAFRDGDIVISTPSKSGTTLMQMLVALVVFDGPDFPAPVNVMSPWLDMLTQPLDDVVARLEAQEHRRFIKTHAPLDALPWDDRVTYLLVGRDPRDVSLSMWHHMQNLRSDRTRAAVLEVAGEEHLSTLPYADVDWPEALADHLAFEVEFDGLSSHAATNLAYVLHHLRTGWERRHLPNVALFHYADLTNDLAREVQRLGDVLGCPRSPRRAEELAAEASLERMRSRAEEVAPVGEQGLWHDPARFFRRGGRSEWRELVSDEVAARYDERVRELAAPDLAAWVHHGWHGRHDADQSSSSGSSS